MWPLVFSLFYSIVSAQTCAEDLTRILSRDPIPDAVEVAVQGANVAIGKALTQEQSQALEKILRKTAGDNYVATDILEQNKILKKAGFYPEDVDLLRKKNILGNTVIKFTKGTPTGYKIQEVALRELDSGALKEIQAGKKYNYLTGENGEIHITKDAVDFPPDKLIIAQNKSAKTSSFEPPLLVREAGELGYDAKTKNLVFKPTHTFENNEVASRAMLDKVKTLNPELKASMAASATSAKTPASRVLKCLDIVSGQSNGKNFVLNRMIADNAVAVSAITTAEMMGAGRLNTEEGKSMLLGDLVGGNVNTVIGSVMGLKLVKSDLSFGQSLAVRAGMGITGVEVQKVFHEQLVKSEDSQAAEKIAAFNTLHFIARLPINQAFDKFMINKLPNMIFDACQRNPALAVAISPVSVRMYERYASTVIYYGLRTPFEQ